LLSWFISELALVNSWMNWIRWRGPTLLCRPVLLRVPDLKEDLAGLVGCASQHGLRPAGPRKVAGPRRRRAGRSYEFWLLSRLFPPLRDDARALTPIK
jgi:hypothetical protein